MSKRGDKEFLSDIKESIKRIEFYIENLEYKEFLNDIKVQDAVIRNLEIIGETVKNISDEIKEKYPDIPWEELSGLRDRLIHHYFGVNYDIVWTIVKTELPNIAMLIEQIAAN